MSDSKPTAVNPPAARDSDAPSGIENAQLQWDETGQPFSTAFEDIYFSRANGLAETEHVFLKHNQLHERFSALDSTDRFCIGETGFGSGLNFLAAWQLFEKTAAAGAQLHFISAEKFPLTPSDLARALALWPQLADFSTRLIAQYPAIVTPGFYPIVLVPGRVYLTLLIEDAAAGFSQLLASDHPHFLRHGCKIDAWFLDGFAPSKNPQMWSDPLFDAISHLSHEGTSAATFSAAGIVKRGLKRAGFALTKVPGFGKKREMLSARWSDTCSIDRASTDLPPTDTVSPDITSTDIPSADTAATQATTASELAHAQAAFARLKSAMPYQSPWHLNGAPQNTPDARRIAIVGAGLAGCHSARALAERGWQVTVFDSADEIAAGASGNPQGVVYAKLSPKQETQAQFNETALHFAQQSYRDYWRDHPEGGAVCGVLQLAYSDKEAQLHQDLRAKYGDRPYLVEFVDAARASQIAGTATPYSGIFLPNAGWIDPVQLCQHLLQHPNIEVRTASEIRKLTATESGWTLDVFHNHTHREHGFAKVVLCTAQATNELLPELQFPLKTIRGQITYFAKENAPELNSVVCANGYIAPAAQGRFTTGATFDLREKNLALRQEDHASNLSNLTQALPGFSARVSQLLKDSPTQLEGRAGLRCSLPDYLPLVGPVPQVAQLRKDFAKLGKNAQAPLKVAGTYQPGLYVNVGMGSRGLAYSPLCAHLLASYINQEPPPVTRDLLLSLHPARFLIRDIIRNK